MILKQYYLGCLAHASYLIADPTTKVAALVDPQRDIDHYLEEAAALDLSIQHVFLTHFHADFLAGHIEVQKKTGAKIYLGRAANAEYTFHGVKDGDVISLGGVELRILETPGHTPEGICLLVAENAEAKPSAILTGDTLFIGDVGRPDLLASVGVTAEDLAGMLYDSVDTKILPLPDSVVIYPAHGAGSACGKNISSETFARLGDQRVVNPMLQPMSKEAFVKKLTANMAPAPPYFSYDAQLNKQNRPTLDENLEKSLKPLSLEDTMRLGNTGAVLLDVHTADEYAKNHMFGTVNIGLQGSFATWVGTMLDPKTPIVIIADPGREQEAATRLGRIGFDSIAGYLDGGMNALKERDDLVRSYQRSTPESLAQALDSDQPPLVVDVRTLAEWNDTHIEGSLHIPLTELEARMREIPKDRDLIALCRSGYRSSIASSMLERHGFTSVTDAEGGILAWTAYHVGAGPQ